MWVKEFLNFSLWLHSGEFWNLDFEEITIDFLVCLEQNDSWDSLDLELG